MFNEQKREEKKKKRRGGKKEERKQQAINLETWNCFGQIVTERFLPKSRVAAKK